MAGITPGEVKAWPNRQIRRIPNGTKTRAETLRNVCTKHSNGGNHAPSSTAIGEVCIRSAKLVVLISQVVLLLTLN